MARKSKKYKMNNSNGYGWVILMIVIVIILITIPCVCSNRKRENLKADYSGIMNTQDTIQCKTRSGSMIKPLNDICPGCTTKSSAPSPSPSKGGCKAVKTKQCPPFNNSSWTPNNGWDWAHFYSGTRDNAPKTTWIPYNSSQVGKKTTDVQPVPNGADPSCGAGDWATLTKCFDAYGKDAKNRYFSSYDGQTATSGTCYQHKDGHINLISDLTGVNEGKVATVAHGAFGTTLLGAMCTTGKFDLSLLGEIPTRLVKSQDWTSSSPKYIDKIPKQTLPTGKNVPNSDWLGCTMTKFNVLKAQLGEMYDALITGKSHPNYTKWAPYGFKRQNANGSNSVLIRKKIFENAGIVLPSTANGQYDITNDGIAISWGHGLGKGGCGSVTLMQQGIGPHNVCSNGSVDCTTSGNTILNFQIGTRAWSGEFSDSDSKQGYISECMCGNDDSASCLQPIFKTLDLNDFVKLLQALPPAEYGSMSGGAGKCKYCAIGSGGDCQAVLKKKTNPNGPDTVPYLACYPGTPSSDGKSPPTCPGSTDVCENTSGLAPGSAVPSKYPPPPPSIAKACSGGSSIQSCASVCAQQEPGSTVKYNWDSKCKGISAPPGGCTAADSTIKNWIYCCGGTPAPGPSGSGTCECLNPPKGKTSCGGNCASMTTEPQCNSTTATWGCQWKK